MRKLQLGDYWSPNELHYFILRRPKTDLTKGLPTSLQIRTLLRKPRFTKRLLTSWLIRLTLLGENRHRHYLSVCCTRSKEVTNILNWETTCARVVWYVWVSIPELAWEWVTMDDIFNNRASVGGGWSYICTHMHIQQCKHKNTWLPYCAQWC